MNFEYKCSSCGGIFKLQQKFGKSAPKTSKCTYEGGCGGTGTRYLGNFHVGVKSKGYDSPDVAGGDISVELGAEISDVYDGNNGEIMGTIIQPFIDIRIPNPNAAKRRNKRIMQSSSQN